MEIKVAEGHSRFYSRSITYKAPMRQIISLIDLSSECRQSIQVSIR